MNGAEIFRFQAENFRLTSGHTVSNKASTISFFSESSGGPVIVDAEALLSPALQ